MFSLTARCTESGRWSCTITSQATTTSTCEEFIHTWQHTMLKINGSSLQSMYCQFLKKLCILHFLSYNRCEFVVKFPASQQLCRGTFTLTKSCSFLSHNIVTVSILRVSRLYFLSHTHTMLLLSYFQIPPHPMS